MSGMHSIPALFLFSLGVLGSVTRSTAKAPSQRLMRMATADPSPTAHAPQSLIANKGRWSSAESSNREKKPNNGLDVSCKKYFSVGSLVETAVMEPPRTQEIFNGIYANSGWGGDGVNSSLSGPGSSDANAVGALCSTLQQTVARVFSKKMASGQKRTVSLLDAPSGDWFWMPGCLTQIEKAMPADASFIYQGVDIASTAAAMAEEKRRFVHYNRITVEPFKVLDLSDPDAFPEAFGDKTFDIIMSHDALQHNPTTNVHQILKNFQKVGAHYLVVDVDRAETNDKDIQAGDFRFIDLTQVPYCYQSACGDPNPGAGGQSPENEWFAVFELPLSKGNCWFNSENWLPSLYWSDA